MNNFKTVSKRLLEVVRQVEPLLRAIPEGEALQPYAEGKWSRKQIVCHLLDSASNNHQRFVRAAIQGELTFPGYDQDPLVALQNPDACPWPLLVDLWSGYNRYISHVLAQLPESKHDVICHIGTFEPRPLIWIASDYVEHLKHHLNQVVGRRFESAYQAGA